MGESVLWIRDIYFGKDPDPGIPTNAHPDPAFFVNDFQFLFKVFFLIAFGR
jgi:hypothetical protein